MVDKEKRIVKKGTDEWWMVLERKPAPEDKEWQQMADFVIGKTIESVENWDVGPTFIFTDGSSLELYTLKKGFAWVLEEGRRQL